MSKAFTREDDGAGFDAPVASMRAGASRLTRYGARLLRDRLSELDAKCAQGPSDGAGERAMETSRLRALLAGAEILEPAGLGHVALGARVRLRSPDGRTREVTIVTADEVGSVPHAVSAASPLARALLGAKVGDVVEIELPRGVEELAVVSLDWPR